MNQKAKISKQEEAKLWNLQHNNMLDGSMNYSEKEKRFRLRKKKVIIG